MSRRRKPKLPAFKAMFTETQFSTALARLTLASPTDVVAFRLLCFDSARMFNNMRNITDRDARLMADQVQEARQQAEAKLVAIVEAEKRLLETLQFVFAVQDGEAPPPPDGGAALAIAATKLQPSSTATEVTS